MKKTIITLCTLMFLCVSENASAYKYIICCDSSVQCPITIYALGETYCLIEAGITQTEGPATVIIHTKGTNELSLSAYDKDGNRISKMSNTPHSDNNGKIEYIRIILGAEPSLALSQQPANNIITSTSGINGNTAIQNNLPPLRNNNQQSPLQEATPLPPLGNNGNMQPLQRREGLAPLGDGGVGNSNHFADEVASNVRNTMERVVGSIQSGVNEAIRNGPKIAGYPYLSTAFGVSRAYGEYARLKFCFGSYAGFCMQGGVGKDMVFNGKNKDKLSWHAGCGYYWALGEEEEHEITLGISYAETPIGKGGALFMDLGYTWYIPAINNRIGLFLGAAWGIGNLKDAHSSEDKDKFAGKFVWDVSIGVSIKLFADNNE